MSIRSLRWLYSGVFFPGFSSVLFLLVSEVISLVSALFAKLWRWETLQSQQPWCILSNSETGKNLYDVRSGVMYGMPICAIIFGTQCKIFYCLWAVEIWRLRAKRWAVFGEHFCRPWAIFQAVYAGTVQTIHFPKGRWTSPPPRLSITLEWTIMVRIDHFTWKSATKIANCPEEFPASHLGDKVRGGLVVNWITTHQP